MLSAGTQKISWEIKLWAAFSSASAIKPSGTSCPTSEAVHVCSTLFNCFFFTAYQNSHRLSCISSKGDRTGAAILSSPRTRRDNSSYQGTARRTAAWRSWSSITKSAPSSPSENTWPPAVTRWGGSKQASVGASVSHLLFRLKSQQLLGSDIHGPTRIDLQHRQHLSVKIRHSTFQ